MNDTEQRFAVRADQTASQDIAGETVVINFETYHYYGLNRTGTAIWRLLTDGGRTSADLAARVAGAFGQALPAVAADVDALLDQLLAEGLIELTTTVATTPGTIDIAGDYEPPDLEKHEKLDQLILSGE